MRQKKMVKPIYEACKKWKCEPVLRQIFKNNRFLCTGISKKPPVKGDVVILCQTSPVDGRSIRGDCMMPAEALMISAFLAASAYKAIEKKFREETKVGKNG